MFKILIVNKQRTDKIILNSVYSFCIIFLMTFNTDVINIILILIFLITLSTAKNSDKTTTSAWRLQRRVNTTRTESGGGGDILLPISDWGWDGSLRRIRGINYPGAAQSWGRVPSPDSLSAFIIINTKSCRGNWSPTWRLALASLTKGVREVTGFVSEE